MDPVIEIKTRLPIEELVRQYCQLHKKGRNFVCLCPFHNDSHPSMVVSPDKGIAYCFACQSGGDIFSFYQKIERVDFPQSIKDLAEKTGVQLPKEPTKGPDKDEKERARATLDDAVSFYAQNLKQNAGVKQYLLERGVTDEEITEFGLGVAPDGFTQTYDYLLKKGHSRSDIIRSGLAIQKSMQEDRCFDRFRSRLMFPIHDAQGRMAGFGGRTLVNDDAKYMNSSDGPLFHKSTILFNLHRAKDAMRKTDTVIVVEGYFDVLAVHRVGLRNVVASCGTALTEDHAKMLKRSVKTVILCLDSDRAGRDAAERAFFALATEGMHASAVLLPEKDPADLAKSDPELLKKILSEQAVPYIDLLLTELAAQNLQSPSQKQDVIRRMKPLINALESPAEQQIYKERLASVTSLPLGNIDMEFSSKTEQRTQSSMVAGKSDASIYSSIEISLGILLLYPGLRELISEVIPPEEPFALELYETLKALPPEAELSVDALNLQGASRERAAILELYCEQHGFGAWSELLAPREIRRNIIVANKELLRKKQLEITEKLLLAQKGGKQGEEELLRTQYQEILKLAQMAR